MFLLLATLVLAVVYRFARLLEPDDEFAMLAVVLLSASPLFLLFSRVAMTDLPLTLCSTFALFCLAMARLRPERRARWLDLASLALGAGFASKAVFGLLPLVAILAYLAVARPAGWRALLTAMISPRRLALIALVALPWYAYLAWGHRAELVAQLARESEAAGPSGPGALLGRALFYAGVLGGWHIPLVASVGWAIRRRGRAARQLPAAFSPLVAFVVVTLAVLVVAISPRYDRYLLPVLPALALLAAAVVHRAGMTAPVTRLAAVLAVLQVGGVWAHGAIVGRPLHDLVGYWERHLAGDLSPAGISPGALPGRETSWALAVSGGRLQPRGFDTPYVLAETTGADHFDGYEIVRKADRLDRVTWSAGRPRVSRKSYALLHRLPRWPSIRTHLEPTTFSVPRQPRPRTGPR